MRTDQRANGGQLHDLRRLLREDHRAPNEAAAARYGVRLVELNERQAAAWLVELQKADAEEHRYWKPSHGGIGPAPAGCSVTQAAAFCEARAAGAQ